MPEARDLDSSSEESIYSDFEKMLTGDKLALKTVVDLNITLVKKIHQLETESRNSFQNTDPLLERMNLLEIELSYVRTENDLLKQKLALTEDATKMMYLRVEGLSEKQNSNLIKNVANALSRSGVSCTPDDIDYVKRLGKLQEKT